MKNIYISTKIYIALIITASILLISVMVKNLTSIPNIALINNSQSDLCINTISNFSIQGLCDNNRVKIVSFSCSNGTSSGIDGINNCIDPVQAFNYAKDFCGRECNNPASTPGPSTTPSASLQPGCVIKDRACPSPTPCPPNARCIRQVCDPIMICSSPSPTAEAVAVPLPRPSSVPTGCPTFFGKKICLPNIRPPIN